MDLCVCVSLWEPSSSTMSHKCAVAAANGLSFSAGRETKSLSTWRRAEDPDDTPHSSMFSDVIWIPSIEWLCSPQFFFFLTRCVLGNSSIVLLPFHKLNTDHASELHKKYSHKNECSVILYALLTRFSCWFCAVQRRIPGAALLWTRAAVMQINKPNKTTRRAVSIDLQHQSLLECTFPT